MRPRKKDRHLPACVYHRHGAYYYVQRGKWIHLGTTLPEALQEYARLKTRPQSGVGALIDRVLEDAQDRVRPNTLRQYKVAAAKIKAAFVEFAPEQVAPKHIAQFMDAYRKTPNMTNRMRTVLKMTFDHAVRMGLCPSNPVTSIPRLKERRRDRYITHEEYHRIMAAASPALQAIIEIAYLTAQRIGDVLALRLSDVTEEGILFRQQKTSARLLVTMSTELQAAVDRAKAVHGATPRLYLLGQRNGKLRSYYGVRDLFDRAAARAGVEDAHLHDLRAKSLTDAKRQGLDPQQLAGHTTEAQTVRYIRSRETTVVTGPSIGQPPKVLDKNNRK